MSGDRKSRRMLLIFCTKIFSPYSASIRLGHKHSASHGGTTGSQLSVNNPAFDPLVPQPCIVSSMNRTVLAIIFFLFFLSLPLTLATAQTFSVTFSEAKSAQPLDGRLLLLLSTDPSQSHAMQIDDSPRSQIVFGLTVDGLASRASRRSWTPPPGAIRSAA